MSVSENVNEVQPRLKVHEGGKGSSNWLWTLPLGTVFLAREVHAVGRFELVQFQIAEKSDKSVHLIIPFTPQQVWVDPVRFSLNMERFEIQVLGEEGVNADDANTE